MNVMFMKKELNEQFVIDLSKKKNEPEWMLEFRLKSFKKFQELDNPDFGPEIDIDFDNITYYKSDDKNSGCVPLPFKKSLVTLRFITIIIILEAP